MEATKNQLRDAKVRIFTRQRGDAERAIEVAIATFEDKAPTPSQLGDLADAIDALKQLQFYVAVVLAHGAVHVAPLDKRRPEMMARTLDEMKREFDALRGGVEA